MPGARDKKMNEILFFFFFLNELTAYQKEKKSEGQCLPCIKCLVYIKCYTCPTLNLANASVK